MKCGLRAAASQVELRDNGNCGVTSALVLCKKEGKNIILDGGESPIDVHYHGSAIGRLGLEDPRVTMRLQMHVHLAQVVNQVSSGGLQVSEGGPSAPEVCSLGSVAMHAHVLSSSGGGVSRERSSGGEEFFDAVAHPAHSACGRHSASSESELFFNARTPSTMPLKSEGSGAV